MTDVIDRVHGGTVEALAEFDRAPMPPNRPPLTNERRTGPIHVLLAVVLGCSAVLLMAMLGHLSGWRAALAVTVAWVDVALGVACIVRSRRWVTGLIMVGSLAGVGVWASAHDVPAVPRSVLWTGVGLAAASFLAALALSLAPALGRRWSPSTLVLLSVLPVAVAVVTTAALLAPPAVPVVHTASAAPRSFASTSADLAIKTTVPVPGQNSSQFQQHPGRELVGAERGQAVRAPWRGRSGRPEPAADPSAVRRREVPDCGLGQGRGHDPGRWHGPRGRRPLPGGRGQRSDLPGRAVQPVGAGIVDLRQHG